MSAVNKFQESETHFVKPFSQNGWQNSLPGREFPIAVPPERSFFILRGSCSSLGGSKTQLVAAMVSTS